MEKDRSKQGKNRKYLWALSKKFFWLTLSKEWQRYLEALIMGRTFSKLKTLTLDSIDSI